MFRVDDVRAIPIGDVGRIVSDIAKPAPKVGGPVGGAGQILGRTRALGPPVWPVFLFDTPKGL